MIYQNYHKHDIYTNPIIADSCASLESYAIRAKELGHGILSSLAHAWQGHYIECYELAKKYDLKCVVAAEAYFVKNRVEKDSTNCHIVIAAKNENGRQALNDILSEANLTGFYYRPRLDMELILLLPPNDVIVTSACVAGWRYEDSEALFLEMKDHFKDNFFLEVQYHNTDKQKELNKKVVNMSNRYNIPMIMGCDSHYIEQSSAWERDDYILSKGISYEDEVGWFLDYPDGETAKYRFIEQGVLTNAQIESAINNTNIFLEVEEYDNPCFNHEIKMPSLYPELSQEEKNQIFINLIQSKWESEKNKIPKEKWELYESEISKEVDTVIATNHADYFLLDYEIVKKGKEIGGIITPSGRGCFKTGALVHTKETLKQIQDVITGDYVIDMNGDFKKVINTIKYKINEELVQIKHLYGTDMYSPTICTKDHKILVHRDKKNMWVEAQNILLSDNVCVPKPNVKGCSDEYIDLNKYNIFNFDYDDTFIYEYNPYINNYYQYSPTDVAKHIGVGESLIEDLANGKKDYFTRKPDKFKEMMEYIPFSTVEKYREYIKEKRTLKIFRYIKNDCIFGQFIGLLYGDGFNVEKNIEVGLAINTASKKNTINRDIFETIVNRLGLDIYFHKSKNRCLEQLVISSKIFTEFVSKELFISKKGRHKVFNSRFFNESIENQKGILNGLFLSDGSKEDKYRESFDNTSLSLINAYKILSLNTRKGINSISIRKQHVDRGYFNQESYKLRRSIDSKRISEDDFYWYLPVTKVETLPEEETIVYDLTIEDSHSYLINNMVVHNSGVSFFINKLLGLTMVDRISADVKMYPERFMSKTRILEAKSLADIDLNLANPSIFAQAQNIVLGESHSYPMLAYGTLKPKAAWKMYAKSQDINFDLANEVSKQIEKYEFAIKHASDEDEREEINILDYIDSQYHEIFEKSKVYQGIISDQKIHPCSYLLYQGDIRKEIGLIKIKDNLCCLMDGKWAEEYKFLKNDLLKVSVIDLIDKVYKRIDIEQPEVNELLAMCPPENKVWEVYARGCTMGINQVEQTGTKSRVTKYAPKNISELCAFVAAIRPGFKTMYKTFENRESFSYGIKSLDALIQTPQFPQSFILYQEMQMAILNYAGIPMVECYEIIKNIAKKRVEKVLKYKNTFLESFKNKMVEDEKKSATEATDLANKIWQILEDSSRYSFNSAHAYSVAIDSLYGAYLKSHYPLYFYEVFLNILEEKGEKDRMMDTKQEAESFYGIHFPPMRFRQDNRTITADKLNGAINMSLKSIKGFSKSIGEMMYEMRDTEFKTFIDLLVYLEEQYTLSTKIRDLITIQYFQEFGNNGKLIALYDEFKDGKNRYSKKLTEKSKDKRLEALYELEKTIENKNIPLNEQLNFERSILGYIQCTYDVNPRFAYVMDVDTKFAPRVDCYFLHSGKTKSMKIYRKDFNKLPLSVGNIIDCKMTTDKPATKLIDGVYVENQNEMTTWLTHYVIKR